MGRNLEDRKTHTRFYSLFALLGATAIASQLATCRADLTVINETSGATDADTGVYVDGTSGLLASHSIKVMTDTRAISMPVAVFCGNETRMFGPELSGGSYYYDFDGNVTIDNPTTVNITNANERTRYRCVKGGTMLVGVGGTGATTASYSEVTSGLTMSDEGSAWNMELGAAATHITVADIGDTGVVIESSGSLLTFSEAIWDAGMGVYAMGDSVQLETAVDPDASSVAVSEDRSTASVILCANGTTNDCEFVLLKKNKYPSYGTATELFSLRVSTAQDASEVLTNFTTADEGFFTFVLDPRGLSDSYQVYYGFAGVDYIRVERLKVTSDEFELSYELLDTYHFNVSGLDAVDHKMFSEAYVSRSGSTVSLGYTVESANASGLVTIGVGRDGELTRLWHMPDVLGDVTLTYGATLQVPPNQEPERLVLISNAIYAIDLADMLKEPSITAISSVNTTGDDGMAVHRMKNETVDIHFDLDFVPETNITTVVLRCLSRCEGVHRMHTRVEAEDASDLTGGSEGSAVSKNATIDLSLLPNATVYWADGTVVHQDTAVPEGIYELDIEVDNRVTNGWAQGNSGGSAILMVANTLKDYAPYGNLSLTEAHNLTSLSTSSQTTLFTLDSDDSVLVYFHGTSLTTLKRASDLSWSMWNTTSTAGYEAVRHLDGTSGDLFVLFDSGPAEMKTMAINSDDGKFEEVESVTIADPQFLTSVAVGGKQFVYTTTGTDVNRHVYLDNGTRELTNTTTQDLTTVLNGSVVVNKVDLSDFVGISALSIDNQFKQGPEFFAVAPQGATSGKRFGCFVTTFHHLLCGALGDDEDAVWVFESPEGVAGSPLVVWEWYMPPKDPLRLECSTSMHACAVVYADGFDVLIFEPRVRRTQSFDGLSGCTGASWRGHALLLTCGTDVYRYSEALESGFISLDHSVTLDTNHTALQPVITNPDDPNMSKEGDMHVLSVFTNDNDNYLHSVAHETHYDIIHYVMGVEEDDVFEGVIPELKFTVPENSSDGDVIVLVFDVNGVRDSMVIREDAVVADTTYTISNLSLVWQTSAQPATASDHKIANGTGEFHVAYRNSVGVISGASQPIENVTLVTRCDDSKKTPVGGCLYCTWRFSGETTCDTCVDGWFAEDCRLSAANCRNTRCSSSGNCTTQNPVSTFDASNPTAQCSCDGGRFGHSCVDDATTCAEERCAGRGTCAGQYDKDGCTCDENYGRSDGWTADSPSMDCTKCTDDLENFIFVYDSSNVSLSGCNVCDSDHYGAACNLSAPTCDVPEDMDRTDCVDTVVTGINEDHTDKDELQVDATGNTASDLPDCDCFYALDPATDYSTDLCGDEGKANEKGDRCICFVGRTWSDDPGHKENQCVLDCRHGSHYNATQDKCICPAGEPCEHYGGRLYNHNLESQEAGLIVSIVWTGMVVLGTVLLSYKYKNIAQQGGYGKPRPESYQMRNV